MPEGLGGLVLGASGRGGWLVLRRFWVLGGNVAVDVWVGT